MTESAFTVHDIYILYICTHISYQQRNQNGVVFRITATYKALKIQYLWNLEEKKAVIQVFEISRVGDIPGGPAIKTLCFHCRGHGFDPWLGN